ncbi:protein ABHD11 [Drosophila sulfurigaster albostrigata]|uniref:protein ABHD11 n=1 Tax=Drosophila sulfurigaster albostrigata TaxID=89887 RepID=UPI002D21DBA4|nr:protein ABHD11 [Drosophila sulfurigaster albostrigata]
MVLKHFTRNLVALRFTVLGRSYSSGDQSIQTVKMDYAVYKMPHSQLKQPPILLMHGLSASRTNWRRVSRKIAKRGSRPVIAVDARNHGKSAHSPQHTPKHLAADAAAFIKSHKLNRIVALGHSMGGRALMTLALTQPEMVERAIFVDITPGHLPDEILNMSNIFKTMIEVVETIPKKFTLSEGRKFIVPSFIKLVKNDLDLILVIHNLRKTESGDFDWRSNPQAILNGWQETMIDYEKTISGLGPYQGETLLIAALKTKFVTSDNVKIMNRYFPNLRVEYLDSEHKVHMEQPEKFVNLVVDFTKT